jgi:hypothetical protein
VIDYGAPRVVPDIATLMARGPQDPQKREDESWVALARPDLLVLTNKKDLLREILDRIANGSKSRALPADLPEWSQVDRTASFWAIRHYSAQSKPKPEERGFQNAELPQPDGAALGVAVQFDTEGQRLEIRYLSEAKPAQRGPGDVSQSQFQLDRPQEGVWRLVSDIRERGPFPVHFAMTMLGFGVY